MLQEENKKLLTKTLVNEWNNFLNNNNNSYIRIIIITTNWDFMLYLKKNKKY